MSNIGIGGSFCSDCSKAVVSGQYVGGVRKRHQAGVYAVEQGVEIAALKVGASYRTLEKHISRYHKAAFGTIQRYAAGGVSGNVEHFQRVRSHFYAVAVFELNVNAYFGVIACQSDAETRGLFCEAVAKEGIVGVCGNFYAIFVPHVIIPEAVVEMQVGVHNLCELDRKSVV